MPVCQPVNVERQNNGRIKMTTSTSNATIWYSIDDGEYQQYGTSFTKNGACTIKAYCSADGLLDSPVTTYKFDLFISKSAWKVVSADSQHGGNEAKLAIDGKNDTFWHTEWGNNEPQCPHTLIIDMVNSYKVTAITYLARQDGNQNGMVKTYEVYLSTDGETWGQAVAKGDFKNTTDLQVATLRTPTVARYMKFVAKSEINGKAWTSAAEIGIQAEEDVTAIGGLLFDEEFRAKNQQSLTPIYDLQGRRVQASKPGLYIVDKKKKAYR